jgi:hypothetical protein
LVALPAHAREVRLVAEGTRYETSLYVIRGERAGPVVLVVGGIHGDEEAGYLAARRVTEYTVDSGTLLVLPEANRLAIAASRRATPGGGDLNREFPMAPGRRTRSALARHIWDLVEQFEVEWLLDLHEGFDFYLNPDTDSVGQTIIYYPTSPRTRRLAEIALDRLNRDIDEPGRRFSLLQFPVSGSLARAAGQRGVHAYIFETSARQPRATRIRQQLLFVHTFLEELDLLR